MDGFATLNSAGQLSSEFFQALAMKYEDAVRSGILSVEKLQSTRLSDGIQCFGTGIDLPPLPRIPKSITNNQASEWSMSEVSDYDSTTTTTSSLSDTLLDVNGGELEDEGSLQYEIEDVLDNLLEKQSSLAPDAPRREDTELVLETAWKMAQAIIYNDTPRPSLKEILEHNIGYYTAPASPVTSSPSHDGSSGSSNLYTARSISPASFILEHGAWSE